MTALQNENASLKEQLAYLQEQFDWLKKQVFGSKTEQTSVIMDGGTQLSLFRAENKQAVSSLAETITVPEHQRKKKRTHDEWMSCPEIQEKRHEEEHPVFEKCGAEIEEIGEEKLYVELVFVPEKIFVRRHIVKKYKCRKCGQDSAKDAQYSDEIEPCNIRCVAYPKPMISHSFCSPELMAHIVYKKFAKGIPLLRATMSDWVCIAAERWCIPIVEEMMKRLVSGLVIHDDEPCFRYCTRMAEKRRRNPGCGFTATAK